MKILVFLLSFILLLSGCQSQQEETAVSAGMPTKAVAGENLTLFYWDSTSEQSLFEPDAGCLTGAYILQDKSIQGQMDTFEEVTEKSHDIYENTMTLGGNYPMWWVMECQAKGKIPLLTIMPQDRSNPFDEVLLKKTADTIGAFPMPVMIQFYPTPAMYGDAQEYQAFYQKARKLFQKKCPFSAFIWSVGTEEGAAAKQYYPGKEWVDWIGLSLYEKGGEQKDGEQRWKEWYYTWQKEKPLILFSAVSHYSSDGANYTEGEGAEELQKVYGAISSYPRIKAVVYENIDMSAQAPGTAQRQNYLVTDNQAMLASYKNVVSDSWFYGLTEETKGEWFRSPFDAYKVFYDIYVQANCVTYDFEEALPKDVYAMDRRYWVMAKDLTEWQFEQGEGCVYAHKK